MILLPHLKYIRSGSSHLPFKMYQGGFRAFKPPFTNACRVNSILLTMRVAYVCCVSQLPSGEKGSANARGAGEEGTAPWSPGLGPAPTSGGAEGAEHNGEDPEEDAEVELPPPMKPISEPILVAGTTAVAADDAQANRVSIPSTHDPLQGHGKFHYVNQRTLVVI